MESIRVNIGYRPLRIGWVIARGDFAAFREAVRLSYALWGGRYNPIVVADDVEQADRLVELFRVDALRAVGGAGALSAFIERFPHLRAHFLRGSLYFEGTQAGPRQSMVLDIYNALAYFAERREWEGAKNDGTRIYKWDPQDPLADVFLTQFGGFPDAALTGVDYGEVFLEATSGARVALDPESPIPSDIFDYPGIPHLCRRGLRRRYVGRAPMGPAGVFVGDGDDFDDLVAYWNLRAAAVGLVFVDRRYAGRFRDILPGLERRLVRRGPTTDPMNRLAIWCRHDDLSSVEGALSQMQAIRYPVSDLTWNGLNLQVPAMEIGETSVLGIVSRDQEIPKVSFPLSEKPFAGANWFHTQHLVASISFGVGFYGDDRFTLTPPYVPELNERCAREMYFGYDTVRLEPGRVGLVIDAVDKDVSVRAVSVADVTDWIFRLAGYGAQPSNAGLIVRQLITGLGGLQGARVFKIPGVRRLVRTYGPSTSFTESGALQLIGRPDPETGAKFSDHEQLHIEPRTADRLTPKEVFRYLVAKGVFRMGVDLRCPSCRMTSWTPLGTLRQRLLCELCGAEHDATRQLIDAPWHYRRSGIMGTERQAQGAIPVAVTLQQLDVHLREFTGETMYSPSLDLVPTSPARSKCEVDFVWILPRPHKLRSLLILGECKDRGPIPEIDFKRDVENLRRVADALPEHRFKTFVLLAKMAPFTPAEIECARSLNTEDRLRLILLTDRELEPYSLYERSPPTRTTKFGVATAEEMARATFELFFGHPVRTAFLQLLAAREMTQSTSSTDVTAVT